MSGAGKGKSRSDSGGSGDSPMCIKKPSIECLNARFLEEQKLLKSGKNMQSVNIEVETHSALQEQTLLAAYGEWDAIDIKTITNLPPPNKHLLKDLKSSTASTQVDLLLKSMKVEKNESPKVVETNDEDECEEDEECDEEEEDVDDEEEDEEDDDSCSDQSSTTSTSTSNNQRGEGGRVCDCCYCEVFGHGMPAVAPTSRNYNEMRERLRMRLSKRKAEKCEKNSTQNGIAIESDCKSKDQIEKEDERDLEELINFINGTDTNGKDKKKREKPKKKTKEKKIDNKDIKNGRLEKENKPLTNNSNSKTAEKITNNNNNKSNHKTDHKSSDHQKDITSNVNNNNNNNNNIHCHQNSITSNKLKEQHSSTTTPSEALLRDSLTAKLVSDSKPPNGINSEYWLLDLESLESAPNHLSNSINGVSNGNAAKNTKNNKNSKKKIKTSNDKREDNHLSQNSVHNIQNNHNNKTNISATEQIVCNGVIPHHKQNGALLSNGKQNISMSPRKGY